jgi:hypothetical protein
MRWWGVYWRRVGLREQVIEPSASERFALLRNTLA